MHLLAGLVKHALLTKYLKELFIQDIKHVSVVDGEYVALEISIYVFKILNINL